MSLEKFKKRNKENQCAITGRFLESEEDKVRVEYNGNQIMVHKKFARKS